MRIISGTAKGRKLTAPAEQTLAIRPTSDRAREALFSILGDRVQQANVLDLFAGTGAIGLEAFSRDARSVVFVDNDTSAIKILKKNILLCYAGYTGDCEIRVIKHDLTRSLPLDKLPRQPASKFDLIFADPPYSKNLSINIVNLLNTSNLLSPGGLLVVEEECNVSLPTSFTNIVMVDKRIYGKAAFSFYEKKLPDRSNVK